MTDYCYTVMDNEELRRHTIQNIKYVMLEMRQYVFSQNIPHDFYYYNGIKRIKEYMKILEDEDILELCLTCEGFDDIYYEINKINMKGQN